ncbi:hypothetical protein VNO77_36921 [Canavalia gladiata]|uniref:IST1 homolog n=1 Tax=Canavalia gladiata TaxID=3824 RepID=A0AAN9PVV9_CANGL
MIILDMLEIFFGWPKASKCKRMIKRARCRLRQLKNKRQIIATQLRKDLAELIQNGYVEIAVNRVEQLIQDERLVAVYDLLDHLFEFVLEKLPYIRRHKDCPPDINEAVSSLIFASARCGDFPELYIIRKLFGQRYGKDFANAAVELFPGNLVNRKLIESFSVMSLPDDQKYRVVNEIARDNCLQLEVGEHKGNQLVESDAKINYTIAESKMHSLGVEEIERDATCDSSYISKPSYSFSLPESNLTETSALVSSVQQYPPYLTYPLEKEVDKEDFPDLQNKDEIMALVPSTEVSLIPYAKDLIDYVDDIEESKLFVSKDGSFQNQRSLLSCGGSDIDQDESSSERSSIRSLRKCHQTPKNKLRRRSALLVSQGIMEIGCIIYYQKACKSQKYGKKGIPQSNYPWQRQKKHSSSEKDNFTHSCQSKGSTKRNAFNLDLRGCSLEQPCYSCVYYDQECWEGLSIEIKTGIRASKNPQGVLLSEFCHCLPLYHDESKKGMELVTTPQKINRESYSGAAGYHLLTYPDSHLSKPNNEIKADRSKYVSNSKTFGSLTGSETEPPNSRALTIPQNCKDIMLKTHSCTSQQPKHVHPKLPEYEDIVAIFTALKRERECTARGQNNN